MAGICRPVLPRVRVGRVVGGDMVVDELRVLVVLGVEIDDAGWAAG